MRIRFMGVGEAWDWRHYNTSMLVDDGKTSLLLECGVSSQYPVIRFLEEEKKDLDYLDGVFVSHFHYDHAEGLAGLLCIMSAFDHAPYMKPRKKPLKVIVPEGHKERVLKSIESHHPGIIERLGYDLDFREVSAGGKIDMGTLNMRFSESRHSRRSVAVRVESGGKSIAYSGDGRMTKGSKKLYEGADLIVHESYSIKPINENHGTLESLLGELKSVEFGSAALVHINRHERKGKKKAMMKIIEKSGMGGKVFIPEDGDKITI